MTDQQATDEKAKEAEYPSYIGKTNNISTELTNLRKEYGAKYKDLYEREYEYVGPFDYKNKNIATVHLMQFNILADGLSGIHVSESSKDAESQKKTFIDVPKECLVFNYRGFRILEEIVRNDADIICLQECDQFDFLSHYLSPKGFKGEFNAKSSSPCIKIAKQNNIKLNADGVAIFYNSKKYQAKLVQKYGKKVEQRNDDIDIPAINILFTDNKTSKDFIVCCAHLKSTKNLKGESIRLRQLQHLLPKVQKLSTSDSNEGIPVFMGCDLNTNNNESYSTVYNSIMFPSKLDKNKNDKNFPPIPKDYIKGYNHLNLFSAYYEAEVPNTEKTKQSEPMYTTYKKRSGGVMKHCIDYIFYTKDKAKVTRLLSIPSSNTINQKTLLPGFEYPSDHIAIQACFQF